MLVNTYFVQLFWNSIENLAKNVPWKLQKHTTLKERALEIKISRAFTTWLAPEIQSWLQNIEYHFPLIDYYFLAHNKKNSY